MAKISGGTAHPLPGDLKKALAGKAKSLATWESLTPLTRNEWICWIISPKRDVIREQHLKRAIVDLAAGERRPCCWYGCVHRTDKKLSASQKWVLSRLSKKSP